MHASSGVSRERGDQDAAGRGRLAAPSTAILERALPYAPWAFWLGLLILIVVTLLTMPGNPILDLNHRRYREGRTRAASASWPSSAGCWRSRRSAPSSAASATPTCTWASHDLLTVAWHYHWFAIPLSLSALLVLGAVWYRGYLTVGFIRREVFDPTTLPIYGALLAQVVAQMLDVDDTRSCGTRWRSPSSS